MGNQEALPDLDQRDQPEQRLRDEDVQGRYGDQWGIESAWDLGERGPSSQAGLGCVGGNRWQEGTTTWGGPLSHSSCLGEPELSVSQHHLFHILSLVIDLLNFTLFLSIIKIPLP